MEQSRQPDSSFLLPEWSQRGEKERQKPGWMITVVRSRDRDSRTRTGVNLSVGRETQISIGSQCKASWPALKSALAVSLWLRISPNLLYHEMDLDWHDGHWQAIHRLTSANWAMRGICMSTKYISCWRMLIWGCSLIELVRHTDSMSCRKMTMMWPGYTVKSR